MLNENHSEKEDLMWQTHMRTLMRRKKSMETAQIIDEAIKKYYEEQGKPVPMWRQKRDPDWWAEYLIRLGMDPRNP